MHCPKCNKENPEETRFCLKCGTGLVPVCPQCGAVLPPDPDLGSCFACGAEVEWEMFWKDVVIEPH